jgi:hypothetical protein
LPAFPNVEVGGCATFMVGWGEPLREAVTPEVVGIVDWICFLKRSATALEDLAIRELQRTGMRIPRELLVIFSK